MNLTVSAFVLTAEDLEHFSAIIRTWHYGFVGKMEYTWQAYVARFSLLEKHYLEFLAVSSAGKTFMSKTSDIGFMLHLKTHDGF